MPRRREHGNEIVHVAAEIVPASDLYSRDSPLEQFCRVDGAQISIARGLVGDRRKYRDAESQFDIRLDYVRIYRAEYDIRFNAGTCESAQDRRPARVALIECENRVLSQSCKRELFGAQQRMARRRDHTPQLVACIDVRRRDDQAFLALRELLADALQIIGVAQHALCDVENRISGIRRAGYAIAFAQQYVDADFSLEQRDLFADARL